MQPFSRHLPSVLDVLELDGDAGVKGINKDRERETLLSIAMLAIVIGIAQIVCPAVRPYPL